LLQPKKLGTTSVNSENISISYILGGIKDPKKVFLDYLVLSLLSLPIVNRSNTR